MFLLFFYFKFKIFLLLFVRKEVIILYKTDVIIIKKNTDIFKYCDNNTSWAKLFKNAVVYRLRQLHFAWLKDFKNLTKEQQKLVL